MGAINLDEDTMSRILTQAIIEGIGEDEKNNIIGQAIAYLTQPAKNSYSRDAKTPLQEAFDTAMGMYVNRVVREYIEKDETVRAKVNAELDVVLGQFGEKLSNQYELRQVVVEAVVGWYADRPRD